MSGVPPPPPPVPPVDPSAAYPPAPHAAGPRPVMPLNHPYARGHAVPYRSHNRPTFYQQAARASWAAPIVALVLGFLTTSLRQHADNGAGLVIGFVNAGLVLLGLALGV